MNTPGYESLASVLQRAYDQAAAGKGKERHAGERPFTEQPMQSISELLGSCDGLLYQAVKKIQESKRLDRDAAVRELLGAINYIAGAVIFMERAVASPLHSTLKEAQDLAGTATRIFREVKGAKYPVPAPCLDCKHTNERGGCIHPGLIASVNTCDAAMGWPKFECRQS